MKENYKKVIKYLILFLAIVCLITGICDGGFMESTHKGMGICWECIGLG